MNVSKRKRCIVCEAPIECRGEYCSRRFCRMMAAEFKVFCTLGFILTNARWAGGNGLESLEELMAMAVHELPRDEEPLWRLLIGIYEMQNLPMGYRPA